jgi:hypothetical protein
MKPIIERVYMHCNIKPGKARQLKGKTKKKPAWLMPKRAQSVLREGGDVIMIALYKNPSSRTKA